MKYYKKIANLQDRDYLVPKVFKGIGAIIKPLADLIAYFDPEIRNSKTEIKEGISRSRKLLGE
jgi:hypothetical protein